MEHEITMLAEPSLEGRLLDDFVGLVALITAEECGLLTQLIEGPVALQDFRLPRTQGPLLIAMMEKSGLLIKRLDDRFALVPYLAAMPEREIAALIVRAKFTLMATRDMLDGRRAFFSDPRGFMEGARTYGFFCYDRAHGTKLSNIQDTEAWVAYVTALSESEAPILAPHIPLDGCGAMLEIGGNTGVFALALLNRLPNLRAAILDLPAVCEIGRKYVEGEPNADRLSFHAGDARKEKWPDVAGHQVDAVCFKSVLHDWDDTSAKEMIAKAALILPPGGRVIVCERGQVEAGLECSGISIAANLVFAPFYRAPDWYEAFFRELGLTVLPRQTVRLDMDFHIVTAEKSE